MGTPRPGVLGDATAVLSLKILYAGLMFLVSAVVSRGLGPEGRGFYYTPLLAATTVIALCHLGLDQGNVFLFGSRRVPLRKLVGQSGLVAVAAGSLGAIGLFVFGTIDREFFADIPQSMVIVAALLVPFGVHAIFGTGLLILQGRATAPLVASIGGSVVQLLLLGGLALAGSFTPKAVFGVAAVSVVFTAVGIAAMLARPRELISWDPTLLRASLRHSLVLHLGMALLFLHLRVDMFFVKAMLGTAALGVYSLAVVLAESVMLVADSLGTVLTSRQMGGTLQDAAATAMRGVRAVALVGILLIAGWTIVGPVVIDLAFGESFEGVYRPLLILLPGIVLLGMQRVCGPTVLRDGRPWRLTLLQGVGFGLNIVLNLWWIPVWGLAGAAAASTVSYATIAAGFLTWTGRLGGQSLAAAVPRLSDLTSLVSAIRGYRQTRSTPLEP